MSSLPSGGRDSGEGLSGDVGGGTADRRGPVLLREVRREDPAPALFRLEVWETDHPGLVAGITAASAPEGEDGADFGLSTVPTAGLLLRRLEGLTARLDFPGAAMGRQVHGTAIACLDPVPEGGVRFPGPVDGLVTDGKGLLLLVTAADCVPVYLLDPDSGGLGLLHAGWRGTAAGILTSGVRAMRARFGASPERLRMHLGPAICGDCYEVGPEVLRAVRGGEGGAGAGRACLDLRRELLLRARRLGLVPERMSRSPWCTRCQPDHFHSHRGRGKAAGRMAAFLGWRGG